MWGSDFDRAERAYLEPPDDELGDVVLSREDAEADEADRAWKDSREDW